MCSLDETVACKNKRDTGSVKNIEEVVVAYGKAEKLSLGSNVTIKRV